MKTSRKQINYRNTLKRDPKNYMQKKRRKWITYLNLYKDTIMYK